MTQKLNYWFTLAAEIWSALAGGSIAMESHLKNVFGNVLDFAMSTFMSSCWEIRNSLMILWLNERLIRSGGNVRYSE